MTQRRRRHLRAAPIAAPLAILLAALLLLTATSVLTLCEATPMTTQISIHLKAHNDTGRKALSDARRRRLQFSLDVVPDLGDGNGNNGTNATCILPPDCPLCRCTSGDDLECLLAASIEACASKTFEGCYAGLVPSSDEGGFDVEGLCDVSCDKPEDQIPPSFLEICRVCDIFACCRDCPPEVAGDCFPSELDVEGGYTPAGWEPATCSGGGGTVGGAVAVIAALTSLTASILLGAIN